MPWALIRLVQRAGRVDRIGQLSDKILCYSFLPEDGVENILRLRARLKKRIQDNAEVVGSDEVFFDGDPINISDLYSEKAGVFDDDEDDTEVDLASYAYQIWKNATDARPELKRIVPALPNVVYSTKANTFSNDKNSVIVYTRTRNDNDVLSWMDKYNNIITNSQFKILRAAACDYDCKPLPRMEEHFNILKIAVEKIAEEEHTSASGTLGRKAGVRFRTYTKLERFLEETEGQLLVSEEYKEQVKMAHDEIYKYPLKEGARDILSRQLKSELSDLEFADIVINLRNEKRLCIIENDETQNTVQQIICSMGLVAE